MWAKVSDEASSFGIVVPSWWLVLACVPAVFFKLSLKEKIALHSRKLPLTTIRGAAELLSWNLLDVYARECMSAYCRNTQSQPLRASREVAAPALLTR